MTRLFFWPSVSAIALSQAACGGDNTMTKHGDSMKIRLKVGDKALTATLIDGKTTQDFVSLLPLTLTMNDLFGREKFLRGAANAKPDSLRTSTPREFGMSRRASKSEPCTTTRQ